MTIIQFNYKLYNFNEQTMQQKQHVLKHVSQQLIELNNHMQTDSKALIIIIFTYLSNHHM